MGLQPSFYTVYISILLILLRVSQGYKFDVGGKDGWVLNPSESYSHWAQRNRFQVNDTLVFKFKKGSDSVLEVTKDNYIQCNVKNPIKSLIEEESEFKFEKSGPYYFISGNEDHCKKGQKLIIVVIATRPKKSPLAPPPTPTPTPTPSHSPPSASPTPSSLPPASALDAPSPSPKASDGPSSPKNASSALGFASSKLTLLLGVTSVILCYWAI